MDAISILKSKAFKKPAIGDRKMENVATPSVPSKFMALPQVQLASRLALALPFLVSGATKLIDFQGASNEVADLGLQPATLFAAAIVSTHIGGSLLFLTRSYCWLGAGILSAFTAIATLLAHAFWMHQGPERTHQMATFFEHVAIDGGLAMAAIFLKNERMHFSEKAPRCLPLI
jgi:transmembrane protein